MFQFPGFASHTYGFSARYRIRGGLPHSDIFGSKFARNSPKLFAACHVLHRLSAPRHPPNALMTLDRRHSVQGQAAPHNGLLFSQLIFRASARRPPRSSSESRSSSSSPCQTAISGLPKNECPIAHGLSQHLARPRQSMVEPTGIEPVTSSLQS